MNHTSNTSLQIVYFYFSDFYLKTSAGIGFPCSAALALSIASRTIFIRVLSVAEPQWGTFIKIFKKSFFIKVSKEPILYWLYSIFQILPIRAFSHLSRGWSAGKGSGDVTSNAAI